MDTRIVHVIVKIDTEKEHGGEIAAEAVEAIDDALSAHYGGDTYGWHPIEKHNGVAKRSISVEGAQTLPMATVAMEPPLDF